MIYTDSHGTLGQSWDILFRSMEPYSIDNYKVMVYMQGAAQTPAQQARSMAYGLPT